MRLECTATLWRGFPGDQRRRGESGQPDLPSDCDAREAAR
ncbi:hypothetical protein ATKI12_3541 [Kitasatospora sp. Ki12]